MFSFAVWDDRSKRLLLARDRLGIKPLYYRQDGESLAFASELKCLVDSSKRQINLSALSDFFTFAYVPGPDTIYQGVYELPPAHIGVWSKGDFRLRRYWEIRPDPHFGKPLEFFADGLRHHLREAVRLHLVSEVPLGAFLSGGVDSSAIVALMAEGSEWPVKTFTVGFAEEPAGFDERPFARIVAGACGTDHTECFLKPQVEDVLPAIVRSFDEPFGDSSAIPNYLICQAARRVVTVALSGLGGDELFAGYERYRGALLAEYYRRLPRWIRHGVVNRATNWFPEPRNGSVWTNRVRRFVPGADLELAERYQRYIAVFDESEKARLFRGELRHESCGSSSSRSAMGSGDAELGPLDRMLLSDMRTYLPYNELRKTDRLSMCHSLEVRVPFLDHKLVEFVATIPAKYKLKAWQKKRVLIKALEGILPKTILNRRKQGFSIPLDRWLRGPLRELTHAYLGEPALREVGFFDHQTIAEILSQHDRGLRNHESKIWALLTFMLWHDLYMRAPSSGAHR